jgi:hypothetical protein
VKVSIDTKGPPIKSKARKSTPAEDYIIWNHIMEMAKRKLFAQASHHGLHQYY